MSVADSIPAGLLAVRADVISTGVSTSALQILEMVKSLPPEERQFIRAELARTDSPEKGNLTSHWQRTADGGYFNPKGIPNDDPIFKILEEIEAERHQMPGPPPPEFD